nr:hypothetical protein [Tanacetum cinerariifolium]
MKSIQIFLEEFNYIPFGEKPKILLQAWDKFFAIQHAQPEDSNELFQKLFKDLQIINKELIECNHPTFFDDNEDHSVQYKEYLENSSKEIAASNSNQEKEGPPQDFDIRQLIREECWIEICEEQRVIHKSSTSLKNTSQISLVHAIAPILSTEEPEYSLSMGYKHLNTTPEMESNKIIKSGVEELVQVLSENEVTSEDKRECDMLVCKNSPICDDHSEIFSDSNNNDDISSDDDAFEDIEYVKASLPDPEIVSLAEENDVYGRRGREEVDLFLTSNNSIPQGIENFSDDSKRDIRFLEELIIDDSIPFPDNEASNFDNPSFPRPPPEPPDAEFNFELDAREEILVVIKNNDELECIDPRDEIDVSTNIENDDYFPFMFVIRIFIPYLIYLKVFPFLLSPESEDTIFDPELLEDLQIINKELIERNHPTFFDNNEDHSVQYKEYQENSSKEIAALNSNQEKEGPLQDSGIRQLIREECCIEVCEEQRHNMKNTMLELVKICQQKELYCMHDNEVKNVVKQPAERRTRIIESLQNFRVIHKSSTSLKNTSQISLVHAIAPILSTEEHEYSLSMGYKHLNTTPEMESDEIIKSGVEELVQILSENEVTSEDKRECDMLIYENSPICDDHSEIFSDSNNNDDISSDDDAFEDIEYVEASLLDPENVSLAEENDVYVEEEEVDLDDIFQIQYVILREKLLSINRLIANIKSLNDNPTPDCNSRLLAIKQKRREVVALLLMLITLFPSMIRFALRLSPQERLTNIVKNDIYDDSTNDPLLEEVDLFLTSDNSIPHGIENFGDDSEGDIRFLKELLIDDSIPFPDNEASDFDNLSFPRSPSKPPDAEFDFELDAS